jgi:ADP-ribose pyrophosphatase YjhB (NUDIX family)
MSFKKNAFCSYCGRAFADGQAWPRACAGCEQISYLNPLPVAVLLVPVGGGLLCVRRDIEPARGRLALPGGFVEISETWQEAAAREVFEEAGVVIDPAEVRTFDARSAPEAGVLLIFGLARECTPDALPPFVPSAEAAERVIIRGPQELAFPHHTRAVEAYFGNRSSGGSG